MTKHIKQRTNAATPNNPGLYWGRYKSNNKWELLEIRNPRNKNPEIYAMAWECRIDPMNFIEWRAAELIDPDEKPYLNIWKDKE